MQVSKNTVIRDIKKVREYVDGSGLKLHYTRKNGYRIWGNNSERRYLLNSIISNIIGFPNGRNLLQSYGNITPQVLDQWKKNMEIFEASNQISFSDEKLEPFCYFACILERMVIAGCH